LRAATKMTPLPFIRRNVACRRSSSTAPRSGVLRTTGSRTRARSAPLAARTTAEAPRRPSDGTAAPPSCSHRTSAWLTKRSGCAPVKTTGWTLGSRPTRSTNSSSWWAISRPEQGVRAAVDPDDQDGSAVLDLEMALIFVCHGSSFRGRVLLPSRCSSHDRNHPHEPEENRNFRRASSPRERRAVRTALRAQEAGCEPGGPVSTVGTYSSS
jgi:hypothetical protein